MAASLLNTQKSTFQRLGNFWTNLEKTGENNRTIDFFNTKLVLLETYWSSFVQQHDKLYEHRASLKEDEYFSEDWFYEAESYYTDYKTKIVSLLTKKIGAVQESLGIRGQAGQQAPQVQSTSKSLPRLKLPSFSGKQEEWESFKEMFSSMVVNDPTLTPALKMSHLVSSLEGEAAKRVSSFEIVGANFEVAWEALDRRYNNKRLRLATQLNQLIGMSPATTNSASELTRLLDTVNQCKRALKTLGRPIEHWDDWFIQLLVFNLDSATREDWEKSLEGTDTFPTYEKLVTFIENRTKSLETAHCSDQTTTQKKLKAQSSATPGLNNSKSSHSTKSVTALHTQVKGGAKKPGNGQLQNCLICKGTHYTGHCPSLQQSGASSRLAMVKQMRLCINCLREGHFSAACPSKQRCRVCGQPHHTVLHPDSHDQQRIPSKVGTAVGPPSMAQPTGGNTSTNTATTFTTNIGTSTALSTAIVRLQSTSGAWIEARALIDPCSDASFVTERVMKKLNSSRSHHRTIITGLGGTIVSNSQYQANVILKSRINSKFSFKFTAAVVPQITEKVPHRPMNLEDLTFIQGLDMADPTFTTPGDVDCLLGNDVYPVIILEGLQKHPNNLAVAQNTELGWILTGNTRCQNQLQAGATSTAMYTSSSTSIDFELRKFWELEEISASRILTPEEQKCERHFQSTHSRTEDGRYMVRLPFRETPPKMDSRNAAMSRLCSMERKFAANPVLAQLYTQFMQDYVDLGHMSKVDSASLHADPGYFLPHHGVFKDADDKKIRVVFDGSQSATNGESLNDYLHPGPALQLDIATILLRWREFKYVFKADIVKMYRQILVHPDDRKWQRILWREKSFDPVQVYGLNTVTYGTSSAPYQALRVLQQLAKDEADRFPLGAVILANNMYVDDALAGADSLSEAVCARRQLQQILHSAGMQLDKWSANDPALLSDLTSILNETIQFDPSNVVSTLGLRWSPQSDSFHYKVLSLPKDSSITKRAMLSQIAKLYDPLGWLAPVIIKPKIMLQRLWLSGKDWDTPADAETQDAWIEFRTQLPVVETFRIPRWLGTLTTTTWILHGFSDASEKAYSATVYLVIPDIPHSVLLAAKSKVAPLKTISVPRLELLGAELLANLMQRICSDLKVKENPLFCWTDSEIVLAWLNALPATWKAFVANRTTKIKQAVPTATWGHVPSAQNPADLATRGVSPDQLIGNQLWWHGPQSVFSDPEIHFLTKQLDVDLERKATPVSLHTNCQEDSIETIIARFATLNRLRRSIAFIRRWPSYRRDNPVMHLSAEEVQQALNLVIRLTQAYHYADELSLLAKRTPVRKSSTLRRLLPFIDKQGLLRVGGRLQYSFLPYGEKHPLIIPPNSHLASLLVLDAHTSTLHGGPQLMYSYLLRKYWIPQVSCKIKKMARNCVDCLRFQGRTATQQMAPLPLERITPSRPFSTTGLDYAGPFPIRTSKGRGHHATKGYIAIFTCFVTRATHIEVVSDYTSRTFLLAFKRFTSRRGLCHTMFSDHGTTFQGAEKELKQMFNQYSEFYKQAAPIIEAHGVTWKFIPPRAPHCGGIWESTVKSFKHHLKRVIGDATLTFEEFSTLASSIEACLNSRPLCDLSTDASDVAALTPGHFLIGAALKAPPEPPQELPTKVGLPRWSLVSRMFSHFWQRWHKEVLRKMQQRNKWLTPDRNPQVGDLVIITDELQPPASWPLARIESIAMGPDGLPRVATLRTPIKSARPLAASEWPRMTTLVRHLVKLILLPKDMEATAYFNDLQEESSEPMAGGISVFTQLYKQHIHAHYTLQHRAHISFHCFTRE